MKSRAKVAEYAAKALKTGKPVREDLVKLLAAWLVDNKASRQADYLVKDIANHLARENYVFAQITTAHQLPEATIKQIELYLKSVYGDSAQLELATTIDESLIGGVVIDTPNGTLDSSVKRKLVDIIKGVQV